MLLGRTDLVKYNSACERIENFTTRLQGGLSRRPGLRYINPISGPGKLIPFIFSSDQSYVLALVKDLGSPNTSRIYFYSQQAPVLDGLGDPYFILTPWNAADDFELIKFTQIGDTMYLVHPLYPVQKLNRISNNNWFMFAPSFHAQPATQQDEDISGGTNVIFSMSSLPVPVSSAIASSVAIPFATTDIGTNITAGTGVASITAVSGPAHFNGKYDSAVINVTTAFDKSFYGPGLWAINGVVQPGSLTLTQTNPVIMGDAAIILGVPAFIEGDIGKQIVAGTGIAQINNLTGITAIDPITGATLYDTANVTIIDIFDQIAYGSGTWFLRGSPGSYFAPGVLLNTNQWHGSNQFGLGSVIPIRTFDTHPTDYSFQQAVINVYAHILFNGQPVDTFRVTDVGRYVAFAGGYGQIVSVEDSSSATVLVLSAPKETESDAQGNLLIAVSFPGAWFFEDPAFTGVNGFPGAVCFFQSRLFFGGTEANPQSIWGSVVGDFENFAKGTLDDDGIEIVISSGVFDRVLWLQPYLGNIIAGTNRGEYTVGGGGNADIGQNTTAITPTNATATFQSAYGVTGIQPLIIQESLFYVQRLQLNIYEMEFDIQSASYSSKDLTLLNNLITRTPFIEMAYQQNQTKIVWFIAANSELTEDGNLIGKNLVGLTFDKDEGVAGWHRHFSGAPLEPFADSFISMAVIPNNVNGAIVDELWVMMKRSVLGFPDTYSIELFDTSLNVDYATHFQFVSPVTQVTGLEYLLGETIWVVADGALLPTMLMDNTGVYDFPPGFSAIDIQVGLNYISSATTVRPGSSPQGIIKRWNKIWIRIYNSLGLFINGQFIPNRQPLNLMGQATPLFTGDEQIMNLGYDRDARVVITQPHPLPAEVLAMFGQLIVGEN